MKAFKPQAVSSARSVGRIDRSFSPWESKCHFVIGGKRAPDVPDPSRHIASTGAANM